VPEGPPNGPATGVKGGKLRIEDTRPPYPQHCCHGSARPSVDEVRSRRQAQSERPAVTPEAAGHHNQCAADPRCAPCCKRGRAVDGVTAQEIVRQQLDEERGVIGVVRPELVVEVRCNDLIVADSTNEPVRCMAFEYSAQAGWSPLGHSPSASMMATWAGRRTGSDATGAVSTNLFEWPLRTRWRLRVRSCNQGREHPRKADARWMPRSSPVPFSSPQSRRQGVNLAVGEAPRFFRLHVCLDLVVA
jgi:hypothetical protein